MAAKGSSRTQPSKAVYRRRRLVLLLAVVLMLGVLIWGGSALAGALSSDNDASASEAFLTAPDSSSPPSPQSSAPGSAGASDPAASGKSEEPDTKCPAASVKVAASTDAPAYPAGSNPLLTLSVTNTGTAPCEINVGTNQMEFIVTSGSDRIFSSADCQDGGADLMKEFAAGATEKANFTWERLRSAPGCGAVASNPNPGWYVFTARLGEVTSEKAVFQLD
ncbi:hypothetical protein H9638_00615 [Arthrobacter sp. Sa2BUA2]|uniref:DUF4232 domain-containing protein n=1 Tax=Arthrobacter pullicola TaxID=2762224 RepID=A0ABR8YDM0_9MICC|nr:hypothetical protein [Arthrobacter pullicola]MBD8042304.1 hypothetical protein [Arthrobacter pullicola]